METETIPWAAARLVWVSLNDNAREVLIKRELTGPPGGSGGFPLTLLFPFYQPRANAEAFARAGEGGCGTVRVRPGLLCVKKGGAPRHERIKTSYRFYLFFES